MHLWWPIRGTDNNFFTLNPQIIILYINNNFTYWVILPKTTCPTGLNYHIISLYIHVYMYIIYSYYIIFDRNESNI